MKFREAQRRIIEDYQGGMMGIAAVPGSGKTFTLSHLAARLVQNLAESYAAPTQEVLIVTFSNSAVNAFKKRIADILQREHKLLPYVGYRVRTLHGLAHDIVRERPALVGLSDDFQIVDERTAAAIRRDVINAHLPNWRPLMESYVGDIRERQQNQVYQRDFPELLTTIVERVINHAKDNNVPPEVLLERLEGTGTDYDLLRFASAVYTDYQRSLAFRGAVDFSDLVRLALQALNLDPQFLQRLRDRWVYILEDEAQDSSLLQEQMLRLLSGERNWVRVGDPNQAINTTFTTASPRFLIDFLQNPAVQAVPLPNSGRSSRHIISYANELVRWTANEHPVPELRSAFYPQPILPTDPDDPQQNPPDETSKVHIHYQAGKPVSPDEELVIVARSVKSYIAQNPDKTVAILVPENNRGFKMAETLKAEAVPYEELLRSTTDTRVVAAYLRSVLLYLASPYDATALARLYRDVWWPITLGRAEDQEIGNVYQLLAKNRRLEDLLYPIQPIDVAEALTLPDDDLLIENVTAFIRHVRRWLEAIALPIDQLTLTVSQDIFTDPIDIALAYKLAVLLRSFALENPNMGLADFAEELRVIMDNERRFIGFDDAVAGFEPAPGQVTIATMHAAKGLEWDRVYLMSVNNYSFPSLVASDQYAGQKWFVRDQLNLEVVALGQFYAIIYPDYYPYSEQTASYNAFFENAAERLRLLYVAITRAKSDLVITWNTGRGWQSGVVAGLALPAVHLSTLEG